MESFGDLPLDLQRTVIDNCIANRRETMVLENKEYKLPHLIQITYRCSDGKCNHIIAARFFAITVVKGGVVSSRKCPECDQQMYVSHKTAVLDYYLGPERKKKLKGLEKFLAPMIQEDKEQYGPSME